MSERVNTNENRNDKQQYTYPHDNYQHPHEQHYHPNINYECTKRIKTYETFNNDELHHEQIKYNLSTIINNNPTTLNNNILSIIPEDCLLYIYYYLGHHSHDLYFLFSSSKYFRKNIDKQIYSKLYCLHCNRKPLKAHLYISQCTSILEYVKNINDIISLLPTFRSNTFYSLLNNTSFGFKYTNRNMILYDMQNNIVHKKKQNYYSNHITIFSSTGEKNLHTQETLNNDLNALVHRIYLKSSYYKLIIFCLYYSIKEGHLSYIINAIDFLWQNMQIKIFINNEQDCSSINEPNNTMVIKDTDNNIMDIIYLKEKNEYHIKTLTDKDNSDLKNVILCKTHQAKCDFLKNIYAFMKILIISKCNSIPVIESFIRNRILKLSNDSTTMINLIEKNLPLTIAATKSFKANNLYHSATHWLLNYKHLLHIPSHDMCINIILFNSNKNVIKHFCHYLNNLANSLSPKQLQDLGLKAKSDNFYLLKKLCSLNMTDSMLIHLFKTSSVSSNYGLKWNELLDKKSIENDTIIKNITLAISPSTGLSPCGIKTVFSKELQNIQKQWFTKSFKSFCKSELFSLGSLKKSSSPSLSILKYYNDQYKTYNNGENLDISIKNFNNALNNHHYSMEFIKYLVKNSVENNCLSSLNNHKNIKLLLKFHFYENQWISKVEKDKRNLNSHDQYFYYHYDEDKEEQEEEKEGYKEYELKRNVNNIYPLEIKMDQYKCCNYEIKNNQDSHKYSKMIRICRNRVSLFIKKLSYVINELLPILTTSYYPIINIFDKNFDEYHDNDKHIFDKIFPIYNLYLNHNIYLTHNQNISIILYGDESVLKLFFTKIFFYLNYLILQENDLSINVKILKYDILFYMEILFYKSNISIITWLRNHHLLPMSSWMNNFQAQLQIFLDKINSGNIINHDNDDYDDDVNEYKSFKLHSRLVSAAVMSQSSTMMTFIENFDTKDYFNSSWFNNINKELLPYSGHSPHLTNHLFMGTTLFDYCLITSLDMSFISQYIYYMEYIKMESLNKFLYVLIKCNKRDYNIEKVTHVIKILTAKPYECTMHEKYLTYIKNKYC